MGIARRVVLLGRPNVGKSSIMHALTGRRINISNYPGTTVEVASGRFTISGIDVEVIDTPGIYSLGHTLGGDGGREDRSEEQATTSSLIDSTNIDLIVVVVDAVNLESHLPLAMEAQNSGVAVILALNQIDRAAELGLNLDVSFLEEALRMKVVPVSALTKKGIERLRACIVSTLRKNPSKIEGRPRLDSGCVDHGDDRLFRAKKTKEIAHRTIVSCTGGGFGFLEMVFDDQLTGPILSLLILYLSFIATVGVTRAGEVFFGAPFAQLADAISSILLNLKPLSALSGTRWDGVLRAGIREGVLLPVTVVMPAMMGVYLVLGFLEDSGLLARLTINSERFMNLFGLSGEAVIPLILGFGCRAPAVLGSRAVSGSVCRSKVVMLVCLGVPCAAGMAMTAGMIARFDADAKIVWTTVASTFFILGLALKAFPRLIDPVLGGRQGAAPGLAIEVPPIRMPVPGNVLSKTWVRMSSFFQHVLPMMFIVGFGARVLIEAGIWNLASTPSPFTMRLFGVQSGTFAALMLTAIQKYLAPAALLTLPLEPREATIASAMLMLSIPCLPVSILVMKEMGPRYLAGLWLTGIILSLSAGFFLNAALP
jgi:ferrous iron transport protein B